MADLFEKVIGRTEKITCGKCKKVLYMRDYTTEDTVEDVVRGFNKDDSRQCPKCKVKWTNRIREVSHTGSGYKRTVKPIDEVDGENEVKPWADMDSREKRNTVIFGMVSLTIIIGLFLGLVAIVSYIFD